MELDPLLRFPINIKGMPRVICPFCNNEVVLHRFQQTANKPFCANCGWNVSRAQSELAKRTNTVKLFAAAFLLSVAALIVLAIRQRGVPEFFPLPLLMGVIAFAYAWNCWGTKRALSEALLAGKSDPVSPGHVLMPPLFLQTVRAVPRPRRIALRLIAKLSVFFFAVVMVVPGVIVYLVVESLMAGPLAMKELYPLAPLFGILVILVGAMVLAFRNEARKLALLRDGEVAGARVLTQRVIARGKHSYNEINYEFQVPRGALIRKTERDHTRQIFEEMEIPVFYDSASPEKCVALCATYYRLRDAEL